MPGAGHATGLRESCSPTATIPAGEQARGAAGAPGASAALLPDALRRLPASFAGNLPCADCPGIRYRLNLFPDRSFYLCMTYVGKGKGASSYDIGTWTLSSSPMAGTMLACIDGMETEDAFLKALPRVRTWNILGPILELYDEAGKLLARFEARKAVATKQGQATRR